MLMMIIVTVLYSSFERLQESCKNLIVFRCHMCKRYLAVIRFQFFRPFPGRVFSALIFSSSCVSGAASILLTKTLTAG